MRKDRSRASSTSNRALVSISSENMAILISSCSRANIRPRASSGQLNHGEGLRRQTLLAAGETHGLGRGRLHADTVDRQFSEGRQALAHGLAMGAKLRPLADQRYVHIHQPPAARVQTID